jgi:hypothetical protein
VRLQAERHAGEKAKLEKQKDAAMVTVGGMYQCERASHKKVHGAISSAADVLQHARLTQGAAQKMASLAHRALAATPADQRPALEAELSRARMGLSSSQHAMSQSVGRASKELVTASVQVRQHHKAAHDYMPGV